MSDQTYDPTEITIHDLPKPQQYPEGRYVWMLQDYEKKVASNGTGFHKVTFKPVKGQALDSQDMDGLGWWPVEVNFFHNEKGIQALQKMLFAINDAWKNVPQDNAPTFADMLEQSICKSVVGTIEHKTKKEGEGFWANLKSFGWESAEDYDIPLSA